MGFAFCKQHTRERKVKQKSDRDGSGVLVRLLPGSLCRDLSTSTKEVSVNVFSINQFDAGMNSVVNHALLRVQIGEKAPRGIIRLEVRSSSTISSCTEADRMTLLMRRNLSVVLLTVDVFAGTVFIAFSDDAAIVPTTWKPRSVVHRGEQILQMVPSISKSASVSGGGRGALHRFIKVRKSRGGRRLSLIHI